MSVQTDLEARVASLRGVLDNSNAALTNKGGGAVESLSGIPAAIQSLPSGMELNDVSIMPTGQDFDVTPEEGTGFGTISVAGDMNLEPQNIAAGVTIYGVEGTLQPGATSTIPEEYQSYVDHAKTLYTGEYANLAILESNDKLNVAFLMDDFQVLTYDETTTEFTAQGWLYCEYTKSSQTWRVVDYTTDASTGSNFVKNIRYSSVYWEYNGKVIWPVGAGGGGGGGGGSIFESSAAGQLHSSSGTVASELIATLESTAF